MKTKIVYVFALVLLVLNGSGQSRQPADYVNPFIGAITSSAKTGDASVGKTFPGAATPFGLVQLSPNTITGGDNGSGYNYENTTIEGFAFTQMSGIGWYGDLGNFLVMPTTGELKTSSGRADRPGEGYRSRFSKPSEVAKAGYYAVTLTDCQIRAEAAAAPHSGMLCFTFPENDRSRIQIDLARRVGGTSTEQFVKVVDDYTIQGWMKCPPEGGGWGNGDGHPNYTVYFYAKFSKPLKDFGVWSADIPDGWARKGGDVTSDRYRALVAKAKVEKGCRLKQGKHLGFYTEFKTLKDEKAYLKVGISFVNIDGARENLLGEIKDFNFSRVKSNATQLWNDALKKVEINGGTDDEKTIFYTALYHTMIDPRCFTDRNGSYPGGDGKVHKTNQFVKRTIFSGWDVFRSQFPLQCIINPEVVNDMLNSLVELADESGKEYLERWEFLNSYSDCMIGNPAVSVMVDAYNKGIRGFNIEKGYRYAKNTCERYGNGSLGHSKYISHTLENAYSEWCLSLLADSLGKKEDATLYFNRSKSYRNIFDTEVKWFRPKNVDGTWFDWPKEGRLKMDYGCTESNPYQQGWFVPHDIPGMVSLMGGKEKVLSDLTGLFSKTPENMMWNIYYNQSNEPVHHVPFLFNRLGEPWQTQFWSRQICDRAYHNSVEGLVGNEDVGQMSAWYVLAASGLHPVCPGNPRLEITSPVFDQIEFKLDSRYAKGKTFKVIAHNNSPRNVYIQSAKLNGKRYCKCSITHQQLVAGGVLELEMGEKPNMEWGVEPSGDISVSENGNDRNNGTKEAPVKTLKRAQELARSLCKNQEVNVILADGTYYLAEAVVFGPEDSGTIEYPVTYRAENEGKAVVSGGRLLALQWEPYRNGIYKAQIPADVHDVDQLYVDGQRQRMARFPNAVVGKNVFDFWVLEHTDQPDPANDPLAPARVLAWQNPEGAYIHAMHTALWGDMHWLVKGKKADGSLDMEGGWQNNRPSEMHPRFRMAENVFEELDAPGEFFLNRSEHVLYYFPLPGLDLGKAKIEVVRLKNLVTFKGSKDHPVRYVNLDGIVFRHTGRTFMENREPLLRSDWTVYRGGAVLFNGAEDCALANCEFDQTGGNSVFVNNYNRRILIRSCYIHHSGANGVAFVGDPAMVRSPLFRYGDQNFTKIDRTPGPLGDNFPEDCRVEDCLITKTGRDEKQTAPVQISMSHKITVSHCSIYDVPRAGININEGTFGGHVIEFCDVFNTVLETGDHGSFNSWGRDRYWTPEVAETVEEVKKDSGLPFLDMLAPNIIRNSRWRCDHGWDIDLDDGSTWYLIYNNLLLNGGLKMREGYRRKAFNNVIINNSLHPHVWYPGSGDVFKCNIIFGAYKPAAMERILTSDGKWGQQLDSNLFATTQCDRSLFSANGCDANSLVGDPQFLDALHGDFRVREESPAYKVGFKNFPMDQFGVYSEKLKRIAKQPSIPDLSVVKNDGAKQIFQWYGATLQNVETPGEQSAAGLSGMSGIILSYVPTNSVLAKANLRNGDVILKCEDINVHDFNQLLHITEISQSKDILKLVIQRNQVQHTILLRIR